jgi:hypothetical protein
MSATLVLAFMLNSREEREAAMGRSCQQPKQTQASKKPHAGNATWGG